MWTNPLQRLCARHLPGRCDDAAPPVPSPGSGGGGCDAPSLSAPPDGAATGGEMMSQTTTCLHRQCGVLLRRNAGRPAKP
eukprot:scaffold2357_cov399-Prasinococcus_capsulatus_cf.AAC.9